jgi:aminopeptidase
MNTIFEKWANVLVHHSLKIRPGEYVVIAADPAAMPLIDACLVEAVRSGATFDYLAIPSHHSELLFTHADDAQLAVTSKMWLNALSVCDKYLVVRCTDNTRSLAWADIHRHTISSQAYRPILDTILKRKHEGKLSWCATLFPTPALAQEANMGTFEFQRFVYEACFLNYDDPIQKWKDLGLRQAQLVEKLSLGKTLLFQNDEGTNLEVDISGMKWMNNAGTTNFPDGEVFTGPNLNAPNGGVNGSMRVSFPTILKNTEVRGIDLQFERGVVTKATATQNESFLHAMMHQDEGASRVGEVALGTNYSIKRAVNNILFDEKIGGTFHMALGKGYPETGNNNQSALHWDLVVDMRASGRIFLDGECILDRGVFLHPEWPA